jgi:dTDP-4-amino-4,6-dideoxygalactose transaminase
MIGDEEIAAVSEVLRKGWLSSGPKTKEFEERFKSYVGAQATLALNSCTAGLHLAVILNGIGPGDEVITTPLTFCATANVVEHEGASVTLADVDPETLLIDPREIERKINKKTKALLPVHYAGHPCDMAAINRLAKASDLAVIEDAAHCLPSKIDGKFVGSGDNLTVFSFYATKNITTGEGGMITGPQALIDQARMLALHGMSKNAWDRFAKGGTWKYDVPAPGYKYNLTDIASALGLVQLERIGELYARRFSATQNPRRRSVFLSSLCDPA